MWDFKLGSVFGLLAKTSAFLIFRFLIYIGIVIGYVVVVGVGAAVGALVGTVGGDAGGGAGIGGFFGFGVSSAILYFLREYLLYMVKAGHIAVLVELMEGKSIPGGKGQINYAQSVVKERFTESSVLFGVDQLIKGILKVFNRTITRVGNFLPIPAIQNVMQFISAVVSMSLTYVDEVILAYNIKTRSENPWDSSRTAIVLYAQNYKTMLKNALFLTIIVWALTLFLFLLVLGPVALVVSLFPAGGNVIVLLFAILLAWAIKQAVIEPFAMCALMQVYFQVIEEQEPNPEWDAKLEGWSKKFGELKKKAVEHGGKSQVGPATAGGQGESLPPAG